MALPIKPKLEKTLPRDELADFLRQLAAQAQSGALDFPGGSVPLAGMKALKISVKDSGEALTVKVRLKYPKPEPTAAPGPGRGTAAAGSGASLRPRYKALKKRMKRDFKDIGAALAAGSAPRPDILAAFVADSRLMTTYRGKGDDHYPAYLEAVAALEAAQAAGDLEAMARGYRELALCKKKCHADQA
ncbi:GAK system XXXCH domain-containing protein [Desulfolutivibrio sp.]|uniref:GAK system XXXCH domain-containing protein n=1 Tax=Desulfolutivibrio sp. TaxID=2773296 RepID=UPI002F967ADB